MEESAQKKLRICTVSDSTAAVLILADCLPLLPDHIRTDLHLREALPALENAVDDEAEVYDAILVVLAPKEPTTAKQANAILETAERCSHRLILICDPIASANLEIPPLAQVLHPQDIGKIPQILRNPPHGTQSHEASVDIDPRSQDAQTVTRLAPLLDRIARLKPRRKCSSKQNEGERLLHDAMAKRPLSIAVQGLAGGVGGTTLAVNLAYELAAAEPTELVCLLDLDLQHGNAATYLDIEESSRIIDAYQNIDVLEYQNFRECLSPYSTNLHVLPAPDQMLPIDALGYGGATHLVTMAKKFAPVVIIDMPTIVSDWSGDIYQMVDMVVCVANQQIRCTRNARKLRGLLVENNISDQKFGYVLNRAPHVLPADWSDIIEPFRAGLGADLSYCFADGGSDVSEACDFGSPLARHAPGNPLRKSILDLCKPVNQRRKMHV